MMANCFSDAIILPHDLGHVSTQTKAIWCSGPYGRSRRKACADDCIFAARIDTSLSFSRQFAINRLASIAAFETP